MSLTLIKAVNLFRKDEPNYTPYDFSKIEVIVGTPPIILRGIEYLSARHQASQDRLVMGLGGSGTFVSNYNQSGEIEFGIMASTAHTAALEILQMTGVPLPITVIDRTTNGTGLVTATACRRVGTPQWIRRLAPELEIFTYHTPRLLMIGGVRAEDD